MKKILFIVMLLASVLFLNACGSEKNPTISDPDADYMTVKEGNYTYTVSKGKVYEVLKGQVGFSMLMDLIDTDLLKNTKNSNGTSYWDLVTEAEVNERINKDIFPNGDEDLTEEEKYEIIEEHYDKLFSEYGLSTEADVFAYYKLMLVKEAYAKDRFIKQLEEKDFTETELKNYFNNNFRDEYHAIVVSFDSLRMLENSLKQLGYKFSGNNIVFANGDTLNDSQVAEMFIKLYNMVNSHKYEEALALNEDVEYSVVAGEIEFNLDNLDKLHYLYRDIAIYESAIQKALDTFVNYGEGENFYTKSPQVYKSGARHSLYMKINHIKYDFETEKENVREGLITQRVTSNYVNSEIVKLRMANNIQLFDTDFIYYFNELAETVDLEFNSKKTDKFLVAKTDLKEYNADELFTAMNRNYGISSAISEIEFNRFLDNLDINTVYSFKDKKVLDSTKWTIIQQSIKDEKSNFEDDMYAENGYPAKIGWAKFIKEVYGANSDLELERFFLFQDVKDTYAKKLAGLEGATVSDPRWVFYKDQMDKMVAEYFNVTGVHLLITVNDANSNPVNPEDWTAEQVELAKDFYTQVMDYINNEEITDDASKKIQNVQNAFNRAPYFVAGVPAESQPVVDGVSYTFNGIEVSKFKSAGLVGLFQDLGTFTNGRMVKEFNDAAKAIWDANDDSEEIVVYGSTKDENGDYEYLVTDFGYHVYVNTKTTPIVEYADGKVLPTLEDAIEYIKDNNSSKLTSRLKTALSTYFKPIYTELSSNNKLQLVSYKALKDLDVTIHHDDFTVNDYVRFLELTIETKEANIKYK
ncbi:MAG: hypothetical protein WC006_04920 [Bacilli bacterium]|nr:hypothetical protein [Bacilli bacterium]